MSGNRCVAQYSDNGSDLVKRISIHKPPKDKKILAKWTSFVKAHIIRNFFQSTRNAVYSDNFQGLKTTVSKDNFTSNGSDRILNKDLRTQLGQSGKNVNRSERD